MVGGPALDGELLRLVADLRLDLVSTGTRDRLVTRRVFLHVDLRVSLPRDAEGECPSVRVTVVEVALRRVCGRSRSVACVLSGLKLTLRDEAGAVTVAERWCSLRESRRQIIRYVLVPNGV